MSRKLGELTKKSEILDLISGEVKIENSDIKVTNGGINILSGNFIQTNSESSKSYSARNAFLQAEQTTYGPAYTGSKGYCILSVLSATNQLKLSGDLSAIQISNDYFYSIALGEQFVSYCSKVTAKNGQIVTLNNLPSEIAGFAKYSEEKMVELFLSDDNAFYSPGHPEIGNQIIENFYGNHAEGGSTRGIGKFAHAEGRDTTADGRYSHAEGSHNIAGGLASHAEGFMNKAVGYASHAAGYRAVSKDDYSYTWNNGGGSEVDPFNPNSKAYVSKGTGTYCINPEGGINGFYIGSGSLKSYLEEYSGKDGVSKNALSGKVFDFSTGMGTIQALSAIIGLLGGKVTGVE